jgi:hypothetical protein
MQLTRFDRWLRENFAYETHIKTLRPPEFVPKGIQSIELPDVPGVRHKHLFIARSTRSADEFINSLKDANLMFFTSIEDRTTWLARFVAPKNKSITWQFVWLVLSITSFYFIGTVLYNLLSQPHVQKMISEAFEVFKG